jgi:hypothetical protein
MADQDRLTTIYRINLKSWVWIPRGYRYTLPLQTKKLSITEAQVKSSKIEEPGFKCSSAWLPNL